MMRHGGNNEVASGVVQQHYCTCMLHDIELLMQAVYTFL